MPQARAPLRSGRDKHPLHSVYRVLVCAIAALLITACASVSPPPPLPAGAPADYPNERFEEGRDFQIIDSDVTLKVYRSGRLAKLGHNHVITSEALAGWIHWGETPYAELYLPVTALVVDDPAARARAGEGFESVPSERDVAGTRSNMLGDKLLAAEKHPFLRISLTAQDSETARADIIVADRQSSASVPVTVTVEGSKLTATSSFQLSHDALGLTPFSALGGAITVADEIDVEVTLVARR